MLIHIGYLTYEEVNDSYDEADEKLTGLARIPNEEIRYEFESILRKAGHKSLIELVKRSDRLLEQFGGEILLVGINYDTDSKQHTCRIEKIAGAG